jgi:ATP-dependent DNA helicase RecG
MMDATAARRQLDQLLTLPGEQECVEFKEAKRDYDFRKLAKYVSALANEARLASLPCAWLVFGVRNDQTVVGSGYRSDPQRLQALKHELANQLTGGFSLQAIHEVPHDQGRVLLFQIPAAPMGLPIAYQGHYYARQGESMVALSLEKLERLRANGQIDDWSAKMLPGVGLDALDETAIQEARWSFQAKQHDARLARDCANWDLATFCNKARLTRDGQVTRTALLLVGKPEAAHHLSGGLAQLTWKLMGEQQAYEHFGPPFLLQTGVLFAQIRNLKQKIIPANRLLPVEVDAYDRWVVLEALHNCIAHQDYRQGRRVIVTEHPDRLVLENAGPFFEGQVEDYTAGERTPSRYRNPFLAQAMVNLNMIDTMGYGIHRMFDTQRQRFFPLPDYDLSEPSTVQVTIHGRTLDENYTRLLMEARDLSLAEVMVLDRVQKGQAIPAEAVRRLRQRGLIEGRAPRLRVAAHIADATEDRATYMRHRALDDSHYEQLIIEFLRQFGRATPAEIDRLLEGKLSAALSPEQQQKKVRNLLQKLRRDGTITNAGKRGKGALWMLA